MESGRYKGLLDRLELGVRVRTDFAVQIDLFVLRGNPFHERRSLRGINDKREHSMSEGIEEGGKNPDSRARIMGRASVRRGVAYAVVQRPECPQI